MIIVQTITILILTAILISGIVNIARYKRRMWENIHDGDTIMCRKPDGTEIIEYVMAYRPEEERVCLSKEGWITKHEFLAGKNEYFLANND